MLKLLIIIFIFFVKRILEIKYIKIENEKMNTDDNTKSIEMSLSQKNDFSLKRDNDVNNFDCAIEKVNDLDHRDVIYNSSNISQRECAKSNLKTKSIVLSIILGETLGTKKWW